MTQRTHGLDIESILRILPQEVPAVLLDAVIDLDPGKRIVAIKNITATEPYMNGHFPGLPVYPAAALIESMLQACTILAHATNSFDSGKQVVTLVGINKTKFKRAIIPGDSVEIEGTLTQKRSNVWRFNVRCFIDDFMVAQSGLVLSVNNREDII
jgi:3-hydroxymyristoyl/3-hydroxydecanoyl-(acyl carrier protein) dehydratase